MDLKILVKGGRAQVLAQSKGRWHGLELTSVDPAAQPFLKWTGGKQWLATIAWILLPPGFAGVYHEAFLGGGAVFFALRPRRAVLSDTNPHLITTYAAVQAQVEDVIQILRRYQYSKKTFDTVRAWHPRKRHTIAARMIYLNKTAFNGLYRVNLRGEFNVPFGRYTNPTICNEDRLRAASRALRGVRLLCEDFQSVIKRAHAGDLVYLDPPFITGHSNNGFHKYNARLFSWADQERLANLAINARERRVHVAVSNADHPSVRELFKGFHVLRVDRPSLVGVATSRARTGEVLFTSYPLALEG